MKEIGKVAIPSGRGIRSGFFVPKDNKCPCGTVAIPSGRGIRSGCIEVLKVVGSGLIVDRYDVWSYSSGFITDPRK